MELELKQNKVDPKPSYPLKFICYECTKESIALKRIDHGISPLGYSCKPCIQSLKKSDKAILKKPKKETILSYRVSPWRIPKP